MEESGAGGVAVQSGGFLTCFPSVLVHLDPSEKATFSLTNTDPVKEGDVVTMKCETDGNPQPEFDFTKDVGLRSIFRHFPTHTVLNTRPFHFRENLSKVRVVFWC